MNQRFSLSFISVSCFSSACCLLHLICIVLAFLESLVAFWLHSSTFSWAYGSFWRFILHSLACLWFLFLPMLLHLNIDHGTSSLLPCRFAHAFFWAQVVSCCVCSDSWWFNLQFFVYSYLDVSFYPVDCSYASCLYADIGMWLLFSFLLSCLHLSKLVLLSRTCRHYLLWHGMWVICIGSCCGLYCGLLLTAHWKISWFSFKIDDDSAMLEDDAVRW